VDGTDVVAKSLSPQISGLHKSTGADDVFADKTFLFGTDTLGRDLWTRVWYGARISVMIAFVTIITDMVIGMSYGLISGYFGKTTDAIMQRIVEISNSIPRLVIVGVLATFMPKGVWLVIVALLTTEWIGMSKIARAEMLRIKGLEYIMASRTLGAKNFRIIFSDVLPNTIGPVITQVMFSIPIAIFTEAFLSFVGVGIVLPQCSIGSLIEDGFNNITTLPYQILPPIIVLALLMLAFNFVGDGLREALAPRIEDM
jgi:oligopeptide transport system permease protein